MSQKYRYFGKIDQVRKLKFIMPRKRRKNRRLFRSRDLVSSSKNIMSEKLQSTLVGVAGEYFVAGELSRRGYIASITLRNSKGIDIIASNPDGTRSISIQVKTNSAMGLYLPKGSGFGFTCMAWRPIEG